MNNSLLIGLIPAIAIVAFILSILAYTRHNKFYVVDKDGNQVTVRNWHNSDDGKEFMANYMNDLRGNTKNDMKIGQSYLNKPNHPGGFNFYHRIP